MGGSDLEGRGGEGGGTWLHGEKAAGGRDWVDGGTRDVSVSCRQAWSMEIGRWLGGPAEPTGCLSRLAARLGFRVAR
ncbi:hypothetical protein IMZ48_17635 [Candidatus Bathyarchaeota archaeon]|nr:hypothetical protein [Candidatus Bathyarchaeota archaeon]